MARATAESPIDGMNDVEESDLVLKKLGELPLHDVVKPPKQRASDHVINSIGGSHETGILEKKMIAMQEKYVAREKELEEQLQRAMIEVVKKDNEMDVLTESLLALRKKISHLESREEELVGANAGSIVTIISKEDDLQRAQDDAGRERERHATEKGMLLKRIKVLENLRQSLVPNLEETDSIFWNAAVSIRAVASNWDYNETLIQNGGIQLLIGLCKNSPSETLLLAAADALSEVAANPQCRTLISKWQGIKPLCKLLMTASETISSKKASLTMEQLASSAAFALSRLAIDFKIRAEIAQCHGLNPLVDLLKNSRNRVILHASSMALSNLSYSNAANKSRCITSNVLPSLVRVCNDEPDESLVFEAMKCLANLTSDESKGILELCNSGGVQATVFMLMKKGIKPSLQHAALGVIGNAALNEFGKATIIASAGIMPLIRLISKRHTDEKVVGQAIKALCNLAFGSQSAKARITAERGGPPLTARLISVYHGELPLEAAKQLNKCMTSLCLNRDNARLFASFGVLEPACGLCFLIEKRIAGQDREVAKDLAESQAMLLASLCLNDEVRDEAVLRHKARTAMVTIAHTMLKIRAEKEYMDHGRSATKPHELCLLRTALPPFLRVGLLRVEDPLLVDSDALYHLTQKVRSEGELFGPWSSWSQYISNEEITLLTNTCV